MPGRLFQFLRLSRLVDSVFPVMSLLLGAAVIGHLNDQSLILLIAVVIILNSAAMIWNDIDDRAIDADNDRPELSLSDDATLAQLRKGTASLIIIGLLLSGLVSLRSLALSLIVVGAIWAYNSKPIQASRRPVASIILLSGTGAFLPFLLGISLSGFPIYALFAGVFWWIGRASLSVLKDYKDAPGDANHNKKTFLLKYGAKRVALMSTVCIIVGYLAFVLITNSYTDSARPWILIFLSLIFGANLFLKIKLFERKATYRHLDKVFRKTAQLQLYLDAGLVLWLI